VGLSDLLANEKEGKGDAPLHSILAHVGVGLVLGTAQDGPIHQEFPPGILVGSTSFLAGSTLQRRIPELSDEPIDNRWTKHIVRMHLKQTPKRISGLRHDPR
jgi:hypothetical protein